jgi:hypothetical protein
VGRIIAASASLTIDLPNGLAGARVLVDVEIVLQSPFTKAKLFELLQFNTVDVQNTQ